MGELKDCFVYAFPKERRREEELRQEEACFGRCRPVLHETVQGSVACSSLERCELRVPTLLSAPCDNSLIHAPPKKKQNNNFLVAAKISEDRLFGRHISYST